jgi:hypothetical protein
LANEWIQTPFLEQIEWNGLGQATLFAHPVFGYSVFRDVSAGFAQFQSLLHDVRIIQDIGMS